MIEKRVQFGGVAFTAYEIDDVEFFPLDPIFSSLTGDGACRANGYVDSEYFANRLKHRDWYWISRTIRNSIKIINGYECLPLPAFGVWLLGCFDFALVIPSRFTCYAAVLQDLFAEYDSLAGEIESYEIKSPKDIYR